MMDPQAPTTQNSAAQNPETPPQAGLSAEPVGLASLIGVQPGAVVSRTLLKRSGGTLTVFGFDAGQSLSEHTAPFDAVVYVLEGRVRVIIAKQPSTVAAGEVVLMPANVPHAVHAETACKFLLTMLRDAAP